VVGGGQGYWKTAVDLAALWQRSCPALRNGHADDLMVFGRVGCRRDSPGTQRFRNAEGGGQARVFPVAIVPKAKRPKIAQGYAGDSVTRLDRALAAIFEY